MQLTIQKTKFIPWLIPNKLNNPNPGNSCKITAEADGTITVKSTNLNLSCTTTMGGTVTIPGTCCIHADTLRNLLPLLEAPEITLTHTSTATMLTNGNFTCRIPTTEIDYPEPAPTDTTHTLTLPQQILADMLQQTLYAASTDPNRTILNSILLEYTETECSTTSIDGRRLNHYQTGTQDPASPTHLENMTRCLIPTQTASTLLTKLKTPGKTVRINTSEKHIQFIIEAASKDAPQYTVNAKTIDGQYPDYRDLLIQNANPDITLKFETRRLHDAAQRVSVSTLGQNNSLTLSMTDPGAMLLKASHEHEGSAIEAVPCTLIKNNGQTLPDIKLNPKLLCDLLAHTDEPSTIFQLDTRTKPIKAIAGPLTSLIMPLN
jgi:DNA polymerase-3 subunit beta